MIASYSSEAHIRTITGGRGTGLLSMNTLVDVQETCTTASKDRVPQITRGKRRGRSEVPGALWVTRNVLSEHK